MVCCLDLFVQLHYIVVLPGSSWLGFHFGKKPRSGVPLPPRPSPSSSVSPAPQMWCLPTGGQGNACVHVFVCEWLVCQEGQEIIIKNKHAHATILTKASVRLYNIQNTCKYKHLVHMYRRHNMVKASDAHTYTRAYVYTTFRNSNTHTVTVLLISYYIPFPHYTLCENRLCKDNTHIPTQRFPAGLFR